MTESREYTPSALEVALVAWVRAALGATPPKVRIANQGNMRPALPYVEVELVSTRLAQTPSICVTTTAAPGGGYVERTSETLKGTVQISYRGNEAHALGRLVEQSIWNADVGALNDAAGLSVQETVSDLQNTPEVMSTHTEQRWLQDFGFVYRAVTESAEGVEVVERVIGTGDLYTETPGDGVEPIIDVTAP